MSPWAPPRSRPPFSLPPDWVLAAAAVVATDCVLSSVAFWASSTLHPRRPEVAPLFWFSFGLPVWQLWVLVPLYLGLSEAPGLQPRGRSWAWGAAAGAVAYSALQLYACAGVLLFADWE